MKDIRLCDRTLSNGLHTFQQGIAEAITAALMNAGIELIETAESTQNVFAAQNLMQLHDRDIFDLLDIVNEKKPLGFVIVDTDGSMRENDVERLYLYANKHLDKEIFIAFRPSDACGGAFALASKFVGTANYTRKNYLECALFGIAPGGGTLCTELIADYLNEWSRDNSYKIEYLFDAIDRFIAPLKRETAWGYSTRTFRTAKGGVYWNVAE